MRHYNSANADLNNSEGARFTDRWLESWIQSRRIFKEAGVKWDFVKYDGYNQSDIKYTKEP